MTWSGGTLSGNVTNAGTLTVAGTGTKTVGGTLTNAGTIDVTGTGTIYLPTASYAPSNDATIDNQAGATFDFQAGATLSDDYYSTEYGSYQPAQGTFDNAGTLEMTAPSGTTTIDYTLNYSGGTLSNSGAGLLDLSGAVNDTSTTSLLSDTGTGTFTLANGGTLGGTVTVAGTVSLAGGTFTTAAGGTTIVSQGGPASMPLTGATLSLGGSLDTTILSIAGGTLAGTGTITADSQITLSGGTLGGTITDAGAIAWTGGSIDGTITNAGTLTVAGTGTKTVGGTLTNAGTIDVTGTGTIYLPTASYAPSNDATIDNQAGATFDFQAGATLSDDYYSTEYGSYQPAQGTFDNAGTLEMTAPSGTTTIDYTLNYSGGTLSNSGAGLLDLSGAVNDTSTTSLLSDTGTGTFTLANGGTLGGTVTVAGTVSLAGGTFTTAAGGTTIVSQGGPASMPLTGATLSLGGSLDTTILSIAGGTLAGTGTITADSQITLSGGTLGGTITDAGAITWTGGSIDGTITNAGTLTVAGTGTKTVGGTLTNAGTIDVTGTGTIYLPTASYAPSNDATIDNQAGATFDFQAGATLSDDYYSTEYGSYQPAQGTFDNAGTLEMTAPSGTTTIDYTLNYSGGTLSNSGAGLLDLSGAVNDTSTTSLLSDTGTGTFTLANGGTLGGTVTVAGTVSLAGGTFTTAAGGTTIVSQGGPASMPLTGATLSLGGSLDTTILSIAGGTLAGTGTITADSQITLSGGTLGGTITDAGASPGPVARSTERSPTPVR